MKLFFVLVCVALITSSMAQRPSFAGSRPIGRPELAVRFKDEVSTETIYNRVGVDNSTPRPVSNNINTDSDNINQQSAGGPILTDQEFVDRVNTWPRENRPFDVLNSGHIKNHLYNQGNQNVQTRGGFENDDTPRSQRPYYAGSRPIGRPTLASRFLNTDTTETIGNRAGETDTTSASGTVLTDREYVNRVNQWPRENRPFDVVNAGHIRDSLNPQENQLQARGGFDSSSDLPRSSRPFFAGSRPVGRPELAARFRDD